MNKRLFWVFRDNRGWFGVGINDPKYTRTANGVACIVIDTDDYTWFGFASRDAYQTANA
jgi:hypothetical protein